MIRGKQQKIVWGGRMTNEELGKILDLHKLWLVDNRKGQRVNLYYANLWDANLESANLYYANLEDAHLVGANLWGANLENANLKNAKLWCANLKNANIENANLESANLENADLENANLWGANLEGANLYRANLEDANLENAKLPNFKIVPERGSFHAFKKVRDNEGVKYIIEIKILAEHKRMSNLVGRKCRANGCKLVAVYDLHGNKVKTNKKLTGTVYSNIDYNTDAIIKPDDYNNDIRVVCTTGIHFFLTFAEAKDWQG